MKSELIERKQIEDDFSYGILNGFKNQESV